jgi:hypothetical protein
MKKPAANQTPQLELLYRDIKIQMEEINELRKYKEAVKEIQRFLDTNYQTIELLEVEEILKRNIEKDPRGATRSL